MKNVSSLVSSAEACDRVTRCWRKWVWCLNLRLSELASTFVEGRSRNQGRVVAGLVCQVSPPPHFQSLCPHILRPAGRVCGGPHYPLHRCLGSVPGADRPCPGSSSELSLHLLGLVFQHLLTGSGHITELEASVVHSLQGHLTVLPRRVAGTLMGLPRGHLGNIHIDR